MECSSEEDCNDNDATILRKFVMVWINCDGNIDEGTIYYADSDNELAHQRSALKPAKVPMDL